MSVPVESSPLAGIGPDLELPASSFTPLPLAVNGSDRGDHHYRIINDELDRLQARIDRLRLSARFLDSSYA